LKKVILFIIVSIISFTLIPNANAVYNGSLAIGDIRVVALNTGGYDSTPFCTGSLITNQIVVSAAHCLRNDGMTYTSETFIPKDFWVSFPGSDQHLDDKEKRIRVTKVLLTNGYSNIWKPNEGNILTQKDDIAFYILEKPMLEKYKVEIANKSDIEIIKQNRLLITHIGYGFQGINTHDGKPYLINLRSFVNASKRYYNNPALEENTVASEETGDKALCPGDSGSPWYSTIDGVEKLVAVTIGGSGCGGQGSGYNGTFGTAVYPYLYLIKDYLEAVKTEPILKTKPVVNKPVKSTKGTKAKNIKCYNRSMDGILEPSK